MRDRRCAGSFCFLSVCSRVATVVLILIASAAWAQSSPPDPLPSWNEGPAKKAILDFVARTSTRAARTSSPSQSASPVFDNDGTLWVEQPMYFQLAFALDRVKALAPQHPEWKTKQPFKAVLEGDMKALAGERREGHRAN